MEEIVSALVTVLVYDVHIVMRVKYVYKRLHPFHVETFKLSDLLRETHNLLKLNTKRLQVDLLIMVVSIVIFIRSSAFSLAKVRLKQACMAIEYQLLHFVALQKSLNRNNVLTSVRKLLLIFHACGSFVDASVSLLMIWVFCRV